MQTKKSNLPIFQYLIISYIEHILFSNLSRSFPLDILQEIEKIYFSD